MDQNISGADGAAKETTDRPPDPVVEPAAWLTEYKALVASVEEAARDWGISPDSRESKFVSALLGATNWLGRLTLYAQANDELVARQNRKAAEKELESAQEISAAARMALVQARDAAIALQCEQEHLVTRMINDTLPVFAKRLQDVLVIRERRWNDGVQIRRGALVMAVTLGLFLGGYVLRERQDLDATTALEVCLRHPFQRDTHFYCDITNLLASDGSRR